MNTQVGFTLRGRNPDVLTCMISGGFLGLCGVGVVDALRDGKADRWR
jgi:hypothetical protein